MPTPITTERAVYALVSGEGVGKLDSAVKTGAYEAAEAYVAARCTWPLVDALGATLAAPDDLVQAVALQTARYLERRNSASGVLGSGEFGVVRVSGSDRDVDSLMAPWRKRSAVLG